MFFNFIDSQLLRFVSFLNNLATKQDIMSIRDIAVTLSGNIAVVKQVVENVAVKLAEEKEQAAAILEKLVSLESMLTENTEATAILTEANAMLESLSNNLSTVELELDTIIPDNEEADTEAPVDEMPEEPSTEDEVVEDVEPEPVQFEG